MAIPPTGGPFQAAIHSQTLLVVRDLYPSKEALDEAIASGSTGALPEQFEALDELLVTLDTRTGRA